MTQPAQSTAPTLPLLSDSEGQGLQPAAWVRSPVPPPQHFEARTAPTWWAQLHPHEPRPPAPELLAGWVAFHNGDFAQAALLASALGEAGQPLLQQSSALYACYVEPREATRLGLLRQVAHRAQARLETHPDDPCALYWLAYAVGRHAQAVSVSRALAQGLGSQVKNALEHLLRLQPDHAEAHFALGTFQAEVIDKVGSLIARMTYGARVESARALFTRGLQLSPNSIIGHVEYARALLALYGDAALDEATALYEHATRLPALDMRQQLDQELARQSLQD